LKCGGRKAELKARIQQSIMQFHSEDNQEGLENALNCVLNAVTPAVKPTPTMNTSQSQHYSIPVSSNIPIQQQQALAQSLSKLRLEVCCDVSLIVSHLLIINLSHRLFHQEFWTSVKIRVVLSMSYLL
jgi:septal ring-binding cell division protein DamX